MAVEARVKKLVMFHYDQDYSDDMVDGLAQRSSTDLGRGFIRLLHRSGREAADRWLGQAAVAAPAEPQRAIPVTAEPALL